jgi:hypothetical protein
MQYRLQVKKVKNDAWQYSLFLEKDNTLHELGVGFRPTEDEARKNGVNDLKIARQFRLGIYTDITYG